MDIIVKIGDTYETTAIHRSIKTYTVIDIVKNVHSGGTTIVWDCVGRKVWYKRVSLGSVQEWIQAGELKKVNNMKDAINVIPVMTHVLGSAWKQPLLSGITLDDKYALMEQKTVDQLMEYSNSNPSGVYAGKMWKRSGAGIDGGGDYYLCWWGKSITPDHCTFNTRKILII